MAATTTTDETNQMEQDDGGRPESSENIQSSPAASSDYKDQQEPMPTNLSDQPHAEGQSGTARRQSQQSEDISTLSSSPKTDQDQSLTTSGHADGPVPPSSPSTSQADHSTQIQTGHQGPPPPIGPPPIAPTVKPHFDANRWFDVQFHLNSPSSVLKPNEIEAQLPRPEKAFDENILRRIRGSMFGMALGDALGAHVEFRPHEYLLHNPVKDLGSGGTWGLDKGQFTDDTSMALCLALSLIAKKDFDRYDQLVRYQWWYRNGFMSSTGHCFDIGQATRQSIEEFQRRQTQFKDKHNTEQEMEQFDVNCSEEGVAGNGALMRLAPVPLFFFRNPALAVEWAGQSGRITHGDTKAVDSCRFYAALIVAALNGYQKEEILDDKFVEKHSEWFGEKQLAPEILRIAGGSYKNKKGYEGGIRGKGYIVDALEAALWAFWSTTNFKDGALEAVNLGDDTDTTAAIYGQLSGAFYGVDDLDENWLKSVYAKEFLDVVSQWLEYEGHQWTNKRNHPEQ